MIALLSLILPISLLLAARQSVQAQEAAPSVPDLRPSVPPEDNAWPLVREAMELMRWPEDDAFVYEALTQPWQTDDQVERLLSENGPAILKTETALQRRALLVPRIEGLDPPMPHLSELRRLARLMLLAGHERLRRGETEAGLRALVSVVRFGHLVLNGADGLLSYKTGRTMKRLGYQGLQVALKESPVLSGTSNDRAEGRAPWSHKEVDLWVQAMRDLAAYADSASALRVAYAEEYRRFENIARHADDWARMIEASHGEAPFDPELVSSPHYDLAKTLAVAARCYNAAIAQCGLPQWEREPIPMPEIEATAGPRGDPHLVHRDNPVGTILLIAIVPAFDHSARELAHLDACAAATTTLIALKCHQETNGHLPQSLGELVPEYLDHVPVDPFDGKPLRYDAKCALVYSIGPNGQDDGGKRGGQRTDLDLVYSLIPESAPAR